MQIVRLVEHLVTRREEEPSTGIVEGAGWVMVECF